MTLSHKNSGDQQTLNYPSNINVGIATSPAPPSLLIENIEDYQLQLSIFQNLIYQLNSLGNSLSDEDVTAPKDSDKIQPVLPAGNIFKFKSMNATFKSLNEDFNKQIRKFSSLI